MRLAFPFAGWGAELGKAITLTPCVAPKLQLSRTPGEETKMSRLVFVLVPAAVIALSACQREKGEGSFRPASRVLPGAAAGPNDANNEGAIHALAEARCERETRCDDVGPDKQYDNRDDCISRLNEVGYTELGPDQCPRGIDEDELTHCIGTIRQEPCEPRGESVDRLASCAPKTLCRD